MKRIAYIEFKNGEKSVLPFSEKEYFDRLSKLRKIMDNKDKFITTGLWKYSRHPNYLGEIILWTGVAIISYSSLEVYQMFTLVSPIFTYLLLVNVSGINLLEKSGEKKWGHLKAYQDYTKNTPKLIF